MSNTPPAPDVLEKFLEKVISRQADGNHDVLSVDALRELAGKYGLDDAAYEKLIEDAEAHRTRGAHFFEFGNWDEAIAELDQAYVVLPHDNELACLLGKAYARHWQNGGSDTDRQRAEAFFRQCIYRDPNQIEAVKELTELEKIDTGKVRPSSIWWILGALLLTAGWLIFKSGPESEIGEEEIDVESPEPDIGERPPVTTPARGPMPLPVSFPLADAGDDFSFESRSSVLTRYDDSYGYELRGVILCGPVTIQTMRARIELLGADGEVYVKYDFDIIESFHAAAIKGDSIPFRVLIFEEGAAPEIEEARITSILTESNPFNGEAESGDRLALASGTVSLPPNYGFELRERNVIRSKGTFGDEGTARLDLILTLRNTGNQPIKALEFQASVSDQDGDKIPVGHSHITKNLSGVTPGKISAVSTIQPRLLPGELRVVESSIYLPDCSPEDIAAYQLELMSIE